MKPLAIDLFCGLGGWTEGFLAEGYDVIGFDIERHDYGSGAYPGQLVLQDVLTLHGSQFRNVACIVASPPCQAYSYRAMPWKKAKALPPPDNSLFEACFRIQREACEAAGRNIPLVVENVRGAQKWVGRARWHFGSYFLWGDVPALMPITLRAQKFNPDGTDHPEGSWFAIADSKNRGQKEQEYKRRHGTGSWFGIDMCSARRGVTRPEKIAVKVPGLDWSKYGTPGYKAQGFNVTAAQRFREGVKQQIPGNQGWFGKYKPGCQGTRNFSSKSDSRKAASAQIAKIPFPLAQHIARSFKSYESEGRAAD